MHRAGFSAKESFFKAISPVTETYFGFEAVVFGADLGAGVFTLRLSEDLGPFMAGARWQSRVEVFGTDLLTTLVLARRDRIALLNTGPLAV